MAQSRSLASVDPSNWNKLPQFLSRAANASDFIVNLRFYDPVYDCTIAMVNVRFLRSPTILLTCCMSRKLLWNMCKTFLEGTFMCVPSLIVCAHLTACVRTHTAHTA